MFLLLIRYIKKCSKRSIIITICFFISLSIVWTNGILKHTGNLVELNFLKKDSIYHLRFVNLKEKGLAYLKSSDAVEEIHIENLVDASESGSDKLVNVISKAKNRYKLVEGSYPQSDKEVMIQGWLLNSIGKKIGETINFKSYKSHNMVSYKIVGVLSDDVKSKSDLRFELYTINSLDTVDKNNMVNIVLKDRDDIRECANNLVNNLKKKRIIEKDQKNIINNMLIEAYENNGSTGFEVFKIMFVSVIFTSIIIGSTYIISIRTRIEDIGIFKALGMSFFDIFKLVIGELYMLMFVGGMIALPSSIWVANYVVSKGKNLYSDVQASDVNYGGLVIEPRIILIGLLASIVSVLAIGLVIYFISIKGNPMDTIKSRNKMKYRNSSMLFDNLFEKFDVGLFIFFKNLRADYILTVILIIAVSLPISEVLMKSYYTRENQKVMDITDDFTKADFTIAKNNTLDVASYVPESVAKRIGNIKSSNGSHCIDKNMWASFKFSNLYIDKSIMNRRDYFDKKNKSGYISKVLGGLYKETSDGYIVKSMVIGYNESAMEELKNHIYEGNEANIGNDKLSKDECILYYPVNYLDINKGKDPRNRILNYKIGDTIDIKVADKFKYNNTDENEVIDFWNFKGEAHTIRKKYKIAAIVDYLPLKMDFGQDASVNIIIPHNHMKDIDKNVEYTKGGLYIKNIKDEAFVEKNVLKELRSLPGYLLSNMSQERREQFEGKDSYMDIEYIKYYIFILVAIACLINLLSYKVMVKKKDVGIMMSLGMSETDIRIMFIGEALVYAVFSTLLSLVISLVRQGLHIREMEKVSRIIGLNMDINPLVFITMFIVSMIICLVSIYLPGRKILESNIMESIGDLE